MMEKKINPQSWFDFNCPLSMDNKQTKISKALGDMNSTLDHLDLTGIYKTPFQLSIECSPRQNICSGL